MGNTSDLVFKHVQKLSCGWVHLSISEKACDAGGISNAKRLGSPKQVAYTVVEALSFGV